MKLNNCRCFWCLSMAVVSKRRNIVIYIVVSPICTSVCAPFAVSEASGQPERLFWSNNELRKSDLSSLKRLMCLKLFMLHLIFPFYLNWGKKIIWSLWDCVFFFFLGLRFSSTLGHGFSELGPVWLHTHIIYMKRDSKCLFYPLRLSPKLALQRCLTANAS